MTTERLIRPSVATSIPPSAAAALRDGAVLVLLAAIAVALAAVVGAGSFAFPVTLLAVLGALAWAERRLHARRG